MISNSMTDFAGMEDVKSRVAEIAQFYAGDIELADVEVDMIFSNLCGIDKLLGKEHDDRRKINSLRACLIGTWALLLIEWRKNND